MIDLRDWTADELRQAARMARDLAHRSDAAGLTRISALWRHVQTRLSIAWAEHPDQDQGDTDGMGPQR